MKAIEQTKNTLIGTLLVLIDHGSVLGCLAICAALVRYSDYGVNEFWGGFLLLGGVFLLVFSIAWKYDRGYYW